MTRLRFAALAGALLLSGCNRGVALYQNQGVIAAAQAAGYTNVTVIRPDFNCAADHVGPIVADTGSSYLQTGHFFTATGADGHGYRVAICQGRLQPTRLLVIGPDEHGFSPDDHGKR